MNGAALSVLCILLLTASCAETVAGRARPAAVAGQPQQVAIEASSFAFNPNQVAVAAGQPVEARVSNVSADQHNFTILNPRGEIIATRTLPPRSARTVLFVPERAGSHPFYCDQFGHSTLGMTGEFVAGGG